MALVNRIKDLFSRLWSRPARGHNTPLAMASFFGTTPLLIQCNRLFAEHFDYDSIQQCLAKFDAQSHLIKDHPTNSLQTLIQGNARLINQALVVRTRRGVTKRFLCNVQKDQHSGITELAILPHEAGQYQPGVKQPEHLAGQKIPLVIIDCDLNLKITGWNEEAASLPGFNRTDALGRQVSEQISDPQWEKQAVRIIKSQDYNNPDSFFTTQTRTSNQSQMFLEWRIQALTDSSGSPVGWQFTAMDVTRYQQRSAELQITNQMLEQKLGKVQEQLDFAMQMLNSTIWDWNIAENKLYHSLNWTESMGYDEKFTNHDPGFWFSCVLEEDQSAVTEVIAAHLRGDIELYDVQFRIRDAAGSIRWIRSWGKVAVWDNERKATRMLGLNTEMTELKHFQQENSQLQKQLFQAQKMHVLGQLTGGIAHDFNNLLASIIGYTGLVLDKSGDSLDPKYQEYLGEVYNAGKQGQNLVTQMLNFGRRGSTEKVPTMISLLVEDSLQLLKPSLPSSIQLHLEIEKPIPSVETNAFKLNQMLMNLCINAKDAMDGVGSLTIRVSTRVQNHQECGSCGEIFDGKFIEIEITDTGSGISEEMLPHIFDPFFTTKEVGRGTGMGLSMVDNLMHEHQGHIKVKSELRNGTSFKLLFPPAKEVSADDTVVRTGQSRYKATHSGHVLVVDDDASVGNYLSEVLKHYGYRVTLQNDSSKALELYQDNPYLFDIVLTDQTMPQLTGSQLMQHILELRKDLPIIICTAYSETLNELSARKAGASGYLNKPIDVDQLIEMVDKALEKDE